MVDTGELDEDSLIEVLCDQLRLARADEFDPYRIPLSLLRRLPEHCAKALSVFPIEEKDDGRVVLACAVVPDRRGILELEEALHGPVEFQLASRAEVALALRHGYARLKPANGRKIPFFRDGQELVEYRPLGELLIDMRAITYPNLVTAVSQAARSGKRLGEFLVAQSLIRPDQIEAALARQQLGEARFAEPSVLGTPAMLAKPVLAERISSAVTASD